MFDGIYSVLHMIQGVRGTMEFMHFFQKRGLFSLVNFRKFRQIFLLILTLFRMLKIAGRVILKIRNSSVTAILPDVTQDENSEIETILLSKEYMISS